MKRILLLIGAVSLVSFALPTPDDRDPAFLKEEAMYIEYTPAKKEAAVRVEAESESTLGLIEVCDPAGKAMIQMQTRKGDRNSLSGFVLESKEFTGRELFAAYPEGNYEMLALTGDGQEARGMARFSHDLLREPLVLVPQEGSLFPITGRVAWMVDPEATEYTVVIEQNENDGLIVKLPAGTSSFKIPDGVLARGVESHVEVGAKGANGNITVVEIEFMTR